MATEPNNEPSDRSAESRTRILEAALNEFATHGLDGARTERIAEAAGVNKALIYYYFAGKEKLYEGALEAIVLRMQQEAMAVYSRPASAGERVLRVTLNHFDRIWTQPRFQSMMQQEMMRLRKGEPGHVPVHAKRLFTPLFAAARAVVQEGIASGELIEADWMQIMLSSFGANVFYFLSAPIWSVIAEEEMLTPKALAARRKALLEFLGQAVFRDRQHGAELAARIYADSPMPDVQNKISLTGRNL